MAKQEELSLWLRLKDGVSGIFTTVKQAGTGFASGMKTVMSTVADSFKNSMFSAVALGTAITQFVTSAIASIKAWAADAKKSFQDFERGMANINAQFDADTINKYGEKMRSGAISVMREYGFAVEDVSKALFDAVSAGIAAEGSIEFLTGAARLAKGGATELSIAVDGMTSIMNTYNLSTKESANVADAFFTAQKFGKTTVEELASSIGTVIPIAKAAGMSYQEVLAALAQMTLAGVSTEESVTALKGSLTAIVAPSEGAAELFKELGIPMGSAAFEGGKFGDTMEKIKNATEGNIEKISALIPNIRGLLSVTSVATDEGLQKYSDILKDVKKDHESLDQAVKLQRQTLSEQIEFEKNKLIPLKLQTGEILSKLELFYLKLGNAARETTNVFQQSTGVYGQIVGLLSDMAKKILIITGLKKSEADKEAEAAKAYIDGLLTKNEGEREALAEKAEIKAEAKIAENALDQEYIDRKAEMDAIAEEARIAFEEQKKAYDAMSAEQKLKLLTDTLGKERVLRTAAQVDELKGKDAAEKAKKLMDEMYFDAFMKLNKDTLDEINNGYKKHWTFILTGAKLNAKERSDVDKAMGQLYSDVLLLMGEKSIEAFRFMQAVSIGETIMKTYQAAQDAYAALAGIPVVGPVLGGVAAGVAVAAGLARVEMIRREQPPAMEVGGYVKKGGLAQLHPAEVVLNKEQAAGYQGANVQHIYLQMNGVTMQEWINYQDRENERMERMGVR